MASPALVGDFVHETVQLGLELSVSAIQGGTIKTSQIR